MMLTTIHQSLCTTCRLRSLVAAQQHARARTITTQTWTRSRQQPAFGRSLHSSRFSLQQQRTSDESQETTSATNTEHHDKQDTSPAQAARLAHALPEDYARAARQRYGDALPEGVLNDEQFAAYERLYGSPVGNVLEDMDGLDEHVVDEEAEEAEDVGTGVLRESRDGVLEEVKFVGEEEEEELDNELEQEGHGLDEGFQPLDAQTLDDLASLRLTRHQGQEREEFEDDDEQPLPPYDHTRTHPLTLANRYGTPSSTIQLPASTFVDPLAALVAGVPKKHISDSARRIFGGPGLPYSTSTPQRADTMPQKAIPLNPAQARMTEMDADVFVTTLMPGIYAAVYGVLIETRKRLGSSWLEGLLTKDGGPRILDAGGAGAGIMAARDVLNAEWGRMHDSTSCSTTEDAFMAIAEAGGKTGGESIPAPVGKATVLTGNEALRIRSSKLLDNTSFLPRLPDYMHATDGTAREKGKYDIIVAPHTLWSLKEDHIRKQHVKNLWSLLSTDGGVLILLEKGVPRGFEMVAAAREMLLSSHVSSPGDEETTEDVEAPGQGSVWGKLPKDKGMIVAPCTNHLACPMYANRGVSKGRKDYCHFSQRYIRPPFLQRTLGAKHRNHEDVEFSYLSIMRGRDLRDQDEQNIIQGDVATERAFVGFENAVATANQSGGGGVHVEQEAHEEFDPTAPAVPDEHVEREAEQDADKSPHSLSLPRVVLPPLKRRGHVIIDMCTPAGTLERWTVPKSFSRQAYRDARKSSWGDIWALGAKTRTPRNVRVGRGKEELGGVQQKTKKNKGKNVIEVGYDSAGNIKEEDIKVKSGGRMRQGVKIKGIRDKRDKKSDGRGRRKNMDKEE
jgi:ribosomal protein RSM22 (predicted rRNA methylase)